jgi:hypothetical protein
LITLDAYVVSMKRSIVMLYEMREFVTKVA